MARRWLLNLGLLAVLAVLALLIWRELAPAPDNGLLTNLAPGDIDRIVIERDSGEMLRLIRDRDHWQLREPRSLPASAFHVEQVLGLLTARSEARYPAASLDLGPLGLADPRLRVRLGEEVFVFGAVEPLSQRRYVLFRDQVFLIADTLTPLLRGPWWNFIDRSLLGLTEEIIAVELDGDNLLVGPQAQALVRRWQATAASIVTPLSQAEAAAGRPLEMRLASGRTIAWRLVEGAEPKLLRPDLQLAYHVDGETLRQLSGRADGEGD